MDKLNLNVVERLAPRTGPTSSANHNATLQEIINSFTQIANVWNTDLQPLVDTLPGGSTPIILENRTGDPNPFINGFDGSQVFTDSTASVLVEDGKYFNTNEERPQTIKETIQKLESELTDDIQNVLIELAKVSQSTGITTRQKQAIGARIFNPDQTSASNSLDGLVQLLIRYSNQLEYDIAGDSSYLDGAGVQTLSFSILDQIGAIQNGHSYDPTFNLITHDHLDIHTHKYHVAPVGAMNGINKTFLLPNNEEFKEDTLIVMRNGVEVQKGYYWSERPDHRGFEFTSFHPAPFNDGSPVSDWIWMHYILEG